MKFNRKMIFVLILSLVFLPLPVYRASAASVTLEQLQAQVGEIKTMVARLAEAMSLPRPACNAVSGQIPGAVDSATAVKKAVGYVNKNLLSDDYTAGYKDIKDENGLYSFRLTVAGKDYAAYVTKNAKLFFVDGLPQALNLDDPAKNIPQNASSETAKTAKPDVKLFVMSYCPYGLQAQKMYLPVYELLKNKADMTVNFVDYAMHGKKEIDENLRQYCIQKEQSVKMGAYLKCFTGLKTNNDGAVDHDSCLKSAGIDTTALVACVAAADKKFNVSSSYDDKKSWANGMFPKFAPESDLNEKYKIQGSPTIILNGKELVMGSRSPQNFLEAVCATFINPPAECKTKLDSRTPSAGFGQDVAPAATGGGCQN